MAKIWLEKLNEDEIEAVLSLFETHDFQLLFLFIWECVGEKNLKSQFVIDKGIDFF